MSPHLSAEDDVDALAETCLRRLANRHGHTRTVARNGLIHEHCPDREAHKRDVAAMAVVLEAAGFVAYERASRPPKGAAQVITNYRRPGGHS